MENVKVDVVIPIYNAYDFTKKCIETVIANTDLKYHTLVLINDKSTDERVLPMLKEVVKNNSGINIELIDNKENQGFVKTVNIGMSHSKNDVVLLNSDTEVTSNWLNKMIKTAYVYDNVATVTPLSNNATLASIPNFLEENTIPNYISLEEYSKVVEECSYNAYPELSTAHGFCMYIRRDAIEKVGLFDDINFGKGYGEENDFSYRCIRAGLVNLLCDNTFIYHKGTQSFSSEKTELAKEHWEFLLDKYPDNIRMNNDLCLSNPYSYIQDNFKYSLGNKHRRNMLIVVHEFFDLKEKLVGGTVQHIYDLISTVRKDINCHVLYYRSGKYMLKTFTENSTADIVLGSIVSYENLKTYNIQYNAIIRKLLSMISIDFAHIHHMSNHYFDLIDILIEKNIPYIVSLHDYYLACPTISLLENGDKYCVDNENRDCKNCLKNIANIEYNIIDEWRKLARKALDNAEKVIAPSDSTKELFGIYYKDIDVKVIEHGMDKSEFLEPEEIPEKPEKKNIAFLGGINTAKGLNYLKDMIEQVNNGENSYDIHLFGKTSEWQLNSSNGNYYYHNTYNRNEIVKILKENNIDLILLLSICPETYSYTLTETTIAEIPVIALDVGALGGRIKKEDIGWILPRTASTEDVENKIKDVLGNEEEYNRVLNNIKKYKSNLKTVPQMVKEYVDIYNKYGKKDNIVDPDLLKESLIETKIILRHQYLYEESVSRIENYHYTVTEYRKEIDRLNEQVGALTTERALQDCELDRCHAIEREFIEYKNHLEGSRKMQILRKIKFIDY